jgi:hypothetical protein
MTTNEKAYQERDGLGDESCHEQEFSNTSSDTDNNIHTTGSTSPTKSPSCCKRLGSELNPCQPCFTTADTIMTGRTIDIQKSFAPTSWPALVWKLAATSLVCGTLIATWLDAEYPGFYLAYATYWSLLVATFYQLCSFWNSITAVRKHQEEIVSPTIDSASCFVRTTWALFAMAAHTEAMASILWWVFEYDPDQMQVTFYDVSPHLIVALTIWFDGLVVNRIPVRWMHWYGFVVPLEGAWIVWSVIHVYANVGNPYKTDTAGAEDPQNDDSIYSGVFLWENNWLQSLAIAVVAIFGIGPIVFLILWLCSLYTIPCVCYKETRRYANHGNDCRQDGDLQGPTLDEDRSNTEDGRDPQTKEDSSNNGQDP